MVEQAWARTWAAIPAQAAPPRTSPGQIYRPAWTEPELGSRREGGMAMPRTLDVTGGKLIYEEFGGGAETLVCVHDAGGNHLS